MGFITSAIGTVLLRVFLKGLPDFLNGVQHKQDRSVMESMCSSSIESYIPTWAL